jgi:hypothetical protein
VNVVYCSVLSRVGSTPTAVQSDRIVMVSRLALPKSACSTSLSENEVRTNSTWRKSRPPYLAATAPTATPAAADPRSAASPGTFSDTRGFFSSAMCSLLSSSYFLYALS